MPFYWWDQTMLLLVPPLLLGLYAQLKVKRTYARWKRVEGSGGLTGAEVAKLLLSRNNLGGVGIERTSGRLSDHYDPRVRKVFLSPEVFDGRSVSSQGVAAHEVGHAIQHAGGYAPLRWRHSLVPAANLGSGAWVPLFMVGIFMGLPSLMDLGIILFGATVLFQIVTLPVEFNASHRAMRLLEREGQLRGSDARGARQVLNAAALTYVAAAVTSAATVARYLATDSRGCTSQ